MTSEPDWDALYRLAVEDDRWQVQLNWDRVKFFLVLNSTILGAAIALYRYVESQGAMLLITLLLCVGGASALLGVSVTREGKRYHRAAVANAVVAASRAGLHPSPASAQGRQFLLPAGISHKKAGRILANPDAYADSRVRWSSISGRFVLLLYLLAVLELLAAGFILAILFGFFGPAHLADF